jgi:pimeloyl-ACP methyl ester carboxylesterase
MAGEAPPAPELPAFKAVRLLARLGLRAYGYRCEARAFDGRSVGLWRRKLAGDPAKRFVLVPGFGDSAISWLLTLVALRPTLKKEFGEIVLLDFPGFGGFLAAEAPFTSMDGLSGALHSICDELAPHTMLGHSLGGWLTARYAASGRGPAHAILVNPAGVARSPETRKVFEEKVRGLVTDGIEAWRPHLFKREPFWFRFLGPELTRLMTREEIRQFVGSFREEHGVEAALEQAACPVTLIWGEEDTLIPAECAELWLRRLNSRQPRSRAHFLKGVGHSPQVENPWQLARALAEHLRASSA